MTHRGIRNVESRAAPFRARLSAVLCGSAMWAVSGALPVVAAVVVPEALPHRAVYDLSLKSAEEDSGIIGVRGRMVIEWADACEGFTTTQQLRMRIEKSEGKVVASDYAITSWESRDGDVFRYAIRNVIDGRLVEEFSGRAERDRAGRGGTAFMTKPEPREIPLPAGIVFPSEHARALVRGAAAGEKRIEVRVFEGSGEEGLQNAVAFVVGEVAAGTADSGHAELDRLPAWRMQMSYFRIGDNSGLPDYQVNFRIFANGVADQLELNYGEFVLESSLSHFEPLPRSGC
jgi:hypothetical protein